MGEIGGVEADRILAVGLGLGPHGSAPDLGQLSIALPNTDDLDALTSRLTGAGVAVRTEDEAIRFDDPWKTQIEVRAAA